MSALSRRWFDLRRLCVSVWYVAKWFASPLIRSLFVRIDPTETGVRLRRAFEEMGVTYNKVGQYLAMRLDILPLEVCRELERLFENTAPLPFAVIRKQVERELGARIETLFSEFDPTPVGAASIAQVHRAVTNDGEEVAVKVQRPRVYEIFQSDMRILLRAASLADRLGISGSINAVEVVREVADYTSREMDFLTEADTAMRVRGQRSPHCYIPRIVRRLCTSRILTMEFVHGHSLLEICNVADSAGPQAVETLLPGVDLRESIESLAWASLRQLFVNGFFHGDPHPGNILVRRDGVIVFIDFGIFGELSNEDRALFSRYVEYLWSGNIEESFRCYARLTIPTAETDMVGYRREVEGILRHWYEKLRDPNATPEEQLVGRYQGEIVQAMRRHHVRARRHQLLFWRVMVVLQSTALRVPVEFDMMATIRRFFRRIRPGETQVFVSKLMDPKRQIDDVIGLSSFPGSMHDLLGRAANRRHPQRVRVERPLEREHHAADRTSFAVLAIGAVSCAALLPHSAFWIAAMFVLAAGAAWKVAHA